MIMKLKSLSAILVIGIAIASCAENRLAMAQSLEQEPSKQQVKDSIQRVAKSVICVNDRLLDAGGIDRQQCEFGISLYSNDCWNVLDQWVSDYNLTDTLEDKAKYERIADIYIICQESKFLKFWVVKPGAASPD